MAEERREVAEGQREVGEVQRGVAEEQRDVSEVQRVVAEDQREVHEAQRVTAEGQREVAEGTRLTDEDVRKAGEKARAAAEQLRRNAEHARQTAEESRNLGAAAMRTRQERLAAAEALKAALALQRKKSDEANPTARKKPIPGIGKKDKNSRPVASEEPYHGRTARITPSTRTTALNKKIRRSELFGALAIQRAPRSGAWCGVGSGDEPISHVVGTSPGPIRQRWSACRAGRPAES